MRGRSRIGALQAGLFAALSALCLQACAPSGLPGLDSIDVEDQRLLEETGQDIFGPLIRGVAYDVPGQRVFVSACARREYECDLLEINLSSRNGEAVSFRTAERYGYTWPSVSPDGLHLAVVRTPRDQQPTQRVLAQELVSIDLQTGAERVLAAAGDSGRFDRVIYADNASILAVRSYRSSSAVQCLGDYCTDQAEIILLRNDDVDVVVTGLDAAGPIGMGRTVLVSLGVGAPFFVDTSAPSSSRPLYYLIDIDSGEASEIVANVAAIEAALSSIEAEQGSLGGWRVADIARSPYRRDGRPFEGTAAQPAAVNQTTLVGSRHAASVMKRIDGQDIRFAVTTLENDGQIPWREVSKTSASYQAPQ